MQKFTKLSAGKLTEFIANGERADNDGHLYVICTLDQWTSGSGRHTSYRVLPPFTQRIERGEVCGRPKCNKPQWGSPERAAMHWFDANPRRKACFVLDLSAALDFLASCARGHEIQ